MLESLKAVQSCGDLNARVTAGLAQQLVCWLELLLTHVLAVKASIVIVHGNWTDRSRLLFLLFVFSVGPFEVKYKC